MKKLFLLSVLCFTTLSLSAQQYVDLGLPSGTKWKDVNEVDEFSRITKSPYFTRTEAWKQVSKIGGDMPSIDQWTELMEKCQWIWVEEVGYKVVGPNGNYIMLPAAGYRYCHGDASYEGMFGCYWVNRSLSANYIYFDSEGKRLCQDERKGGLSLRLIQD